MFAIIKTGGKQYRVTKDDTILVERIAAKEGDEVILNNIVLLSDGEKVTIGAPNIDGAAISATVVRQTRGPKINENKRITQLDRGFATQVDFFDFWKNRF